MDPDNLLAYQTVRVAKIRDRRLGALHYLLMLAILGYIIGYSIVWEKNYLKREVPTGAIRMSLLKPTPEYLRDATDLAYCEASKLPYTVQSPNGTSIAAPKAPCYYYDENFALYPNAEQSALLASTRISNKSGVMSGADCSPPTNKNCMFKDVKKPFYIPEIEKFTLMLTHTMVAPIVGKTGNTQEMTGSLVDQDGNTVDPCDDYKAWNQTCPKNNQVYIDIGDLGHNDVFPLQTLLRAGGINLDEFFEMKGTLAESIRYAGIVMLLQIQYDNTKTANQSRIEYTYRVTVLKGAEFKCEETSKIEGDHRELLDRHGIRLIIVQNGQIGEFDLSTLLLTLVTSLGLMAVATTVVDIMAMRCLPNRQLYTKYKQLETVDFGHLENADDVEVENSIAADLYGRPTQDSIDGYDPPHQ